MVRSLLLRHVSPVAYGHVLAMLARVEALFDAYGLEVGAPELLEEGLVLVQQIGLQLARVWVKHASVVGKGDLFHFTSVVVAPVVAADIIDNPRLDLYQSTL